MEFTVYTRPGCPYCDKIKTVLDQRNLQYTESVLDENFTREQFYEQFGVGSTFPQVIMDGQKLGGCSDTVKYLISNSLI